MSNRPEFLDRIDDSYRNRRKNAVILTGNIYDLFKNENENGETDFVSLDRLLRSELGSKFNLMNLDLSELMFDSEDSEREILRVCAEADKLQTKTKEDDQGRLRPMIGNIKKIIDGNRHSPLANLETIKLISEVFSFLRGARSKLQETGSKEKIESFKPLCVIIQHAGAFFPTGSWSQLSESDRQRLALLLNWFTEPKFIESDELIILVNRVKTEVNNELTSLPNIAHIEISMPSEGERAKFVEIFTESNSVQFEKGREHFVKSTAGLTISSIKDLLEVAKTTGSPITPKQVLEEVNSILKAQLGDIITIKYPEHKPSDIVGYKATGEIIADIFERCEDPETAISAVLISGPNGGGKTFQFEAYAGASGRVVVELKGLRDSLFGGTDAIFERLRLVVTTLGRVLFLIDEAHTAFGSVHGKDTHETEKRLAGNMIKMMGDPTLRGKILYGLMTSRPDELDPDVKSRAPIQVPVFDLEDEERVQFIIEMFKRKKIDLESDKVELALVIEKTIDYSARDFDNLVREVKTRRRKNKDIKVSEVLELWSASKSIKRQRRLQTLIAAQHCSYPKLLPEGLRDEEAVAQEADRLKMLLYG